MDQLTEQLCEWRRQAEPLLSAGRQRLQEQRVEYSKLRGELISARDRLQAVKKEMKKLAVLLGEDIPKEAKGKYGGILKMNRCLPRRRDPISAEVNERLMWQAVEYLRTKSQLWVSPSDIRRVIGKDASVSLVLKEAIRAGMVHIRGNTASREYRIA